MARILVTGGLGTVGSQLIAELRTRGHYVVSADLQHQPDEVGFSLRTDVESPLYARCDISEFRQIERVIDRLGPFEFVYNCAAEFWAVEWRRFLRNVVAQQCYRHQECHPAARAPEV